MAGYICPVRQSQFSQSNDRSWSLAKYTKLLGEKEVCFIAMKT
ncbi:unnamed protein product [Toxocara canis]|uniref:Uncharacterized protein n=1 Tax=Toxocara canis TaxID=6265 RepID=A0A183VFT0_TOXCA|nr:unnamed protein product [Toxocara canis]